MSKHIETLANELIEAKKPLSKKHVWLFGHANPLGSRWRIHNGAENLLPFKKLTREVNLWVRHEPSDHSVSRRFDRLAGSGLMAGEDDSFKQQLANIFHTNPITETRFRAGSSSTKGLIDFTQTPFFEEAAVVTSADVGRMMLVDVCLRENGFVSDRPLLGVDANNAAAIISI
jgi:hypothetical protein